MKGLVFDADEAREPCVFRLGFSLLSAYGLGWLAGAAAVIGFMAALVCIGSFL